MTKVNGYGQIHNRLYEDSVSRPPLDTLASAPYYSIATKGGIIYVKQPTRWQAYASFDSTKYYKQNGNSFGANAHLGTNDNYHQYFKTNGVDHLILGSDGSFYSPTQNWSFNTDNSFQLGSNSGFSPYGDLRVANSRYLNFSTSNSNIGSSGFGFRDVAGVLQYKDSLGSWTSFASTAGTVTSISATTPTGLTVTGSPITGAGTLAFTWTSGYTPVTTTEQTNWQSAYLNRITSATLPLSIASNTISIADASVSASGVITTSTQSIAGVKTWTASQILNATYSALSTSATGGNLRILSSDAAASGKGGTIGLGGNATTTNINFAGISGLREDGISDRGVLNLYTNGTANSGNPYIPRLSISSDGTVTINPTSNNVSYAIPLAVRATSGQSVNMFELRNSSGTATTVFNKFGGLVLLAGVSSASGAPLKFTIGTNLTTPENGAIEYDGTDYYVTAQSTRQKLIKGLAASYSGTGTATTTFTVTFGGTQPNSTYKVNVTPTSTLALGGYVTNKTTTTFDYVVPAATGTVTFDYSINQ